MARPKKHKNLQKLNVYIEEETLEILNRVVDEYNRRHETTAFTLASIVRKILDSNAAKYKKFMDETDKKMGTLVNEPHQVSDQFSWKPNSDKNED